jgi:hypothetical protein
MPGAERGTASGDNTSQQCKAGDTACAAREEAALHDEL